MKQAEQARKISIEFAPLVPLCMKEIDSACNSVYKELWVHYRSLESPQEAALSMLL